MDREPFGSIRRSVGRRTPDQRPPVEPPTHKPGGPAPGQRTFDAVWEDLSREIVRCQRCQLHSFRTQAVVYRGVPEPVVVFVGEAPGAEEDRVGLPFVGRAGRRLDEAVASAAIPATVVGVLNVLKCRPPQNHFDRRAAVTCRPYLDRQLAWLDPPLVVTLGRWALSTLLPTAPPISESAGVVRDWQGRKLLPLVHPAATFHSRRMMERWTRDLAALRNAYLDASHQTL